MNRRSMLKASAVALAAAGCGKTPAPSAEKDLAKLDGVGLAKAIRDGVLTPVEAVEAAGRRAEALNGKLGVFAALDIDAAVDRTKKADPSAPLAGVPFALKDLNNYPGLPFRRGTALFRDAMGDAKTPYTERFDAAGLVVLGKTQTPEFGLLPTTEPLAYAPAVSPWNPEYSVGGSSGGSAAAVAARIIPAAQASDGGGSIRIPASCCGVFGLKPTRGRFPDQGNPARLIDLSIKHAVSRSVRDNALLLALTELDGGGMAPVGFTEPADLAPLKIAMTLNDGSGRAPDAEVAAAVEEAARLFEKMGHEVIPAEDTPMQTPGATDAFNALWANGAHGIYQLAEQLTGGRPEDTGVLEPFTIGLAKAYLDLAPDAFEAGLQLLRGLEGAVDEFFGSYDLWLTPVLAAPPPKLGYLSGDAPFDTLVERLSRYSVYTPIHNVAGTPAMSAPFSESVDGLPIGVQVAARKGGEKLLLRLAYAIEEARPWAGRTPAVSA